MYIYILYIHITYTKGAGGGIHVHTHIHTRAYRKNRHTLDACTLYIAIGREYTHPRIESRVYIHTRSCVHAKVSILVTTPSLVSREEKRVEGRGKKRGEKRKKKSSVTRFEKKKEQRREEREREKNRDTMENYRNNDNGIR